MANPALGFFRMESGRRKEGRRGRNQAKQANNLPLLEGEEEAEAVVAAKGVGWGAWR